MANQTREAPIVKRMIDYLNGLNGCYAIKMHGDEYTKGQPDIFCCLQGRTLVIEAKRPGEVPEILQQAVLRKWSDAGAIAMWADNLEDVKDVASGMLSDSW